MPGNQALNVNSVVGQQADLQITRRASDWYFTVCAVMTISSLVFMALSFTRPRTHRIFHYITAGITLVAAISYFTMGANLGQVPIQTQFVRPNSRQVGSAGTREIFYVRYIDWFVTTPLLLLDLLLTAGVPTATILITILADEIMIVTGLVGALTRTSYKWGYWLFGTLALFYVVYQLLFTARRHASALGPGVSRTFNTCGVLTIFLWFLYPIAWGLCEGGNVIHPDGEAIFYGILDLLAKPVFGALLIWGHRNIEPSDIGMSIRDPGMTRTGAGIGTGTGGVGRGGAASKEAAALGQPQPHLQQGNTNGLHHGHDDHGHTHGGVTSSYEDGYVQNQPAAAPGVAAPGNAPPAVGHQGV